MVTETMEELEEEISEVDNTELIDQLLKTRPEPEPGDFMQSPIISAGDNETPPPLIADSLSSAGYVKVYNTLTGDCSTINRNMLPIQMSKIHPNGKRAFSLRPPRIKPVEGNILCMLHVDHPDRPKYAAMGFPICPADNIRTQFAQENHMKHRHRLEWANIIADRERREKDEERTFQRSMLKAMTQNNKRERKAKAT